MNVVSSDKPDKDPSDHCFLQEWQVALAGAKMHPDIASQLTPQGLTLFEYNIRAIDMAYQWLLWLKHKLPEYKPPRKNSKKGKVFYLYQKHGEMLLSVFNLCSYLHGSPELGLKIPFQNAGDWLVEILYEIQFELLFEHLPRREGCVVIESSDYKAATGGYSTKKALTLKTPKEKVAAGYSSIINQLKRGLIPEGWDQTYPQFTKLLQTFQKITANAGGTASATVLWKAFLKAYSAWARDQTRNPSFGVAEVNGDKVRVRAGTSHRRTIPINSENLALKTLHLQGFEPS